MMNKESVKFPAVITTQEVFGIPEFTVLRFDWASGKYVSIEEEEDIAEDYYYSGYAIAIDPYLVKDNIGTYFVYSEQQEKPEPMVEHTVTEEDVELNPGEDLKEGDEVELPIESEKVNSLVIDCSCGHRKVLDVMKENGLNITIMAEDEASFIELACSECGASLKLWFPSDVKDIG